MAILRLAFCQHHHDSRWLTSGGPSHYPDGRAMILNMFVHTAHHRAQCEVYLRAKGIKPPDYTF
jgi:uncharacterized damage-inducible protein DinB